MKKWILVSLLLLFVSSVFGQGTQWFTGSLDEAMVEAENAEKDVLIFAWSRT